jgi:hypothetical protein
MTLELETIKRKDIYDENPDLSWVDKKRLESMDMGYWHFIGILAVAEIRINGISETISSPGLWNIESDSDESDLNEIYQDQKDELAAMLRELGFSDAQLLEVVQE